MNEGLLVALTIIAFLGGLIAYTRVPRPRRSSTMDESPADLTLRADMRDDLECLLEEIIQNRGLATQLYEVGGQTGIKLATTAWDVVKHNLAGFDQGLASGLRLGYIEVWRFNTFAERDWVKEPLTGTTPGLHA